MIIDPHLHLEVVCEQCRFVILRSLVSWEQHVWKQKDGWQELIDGLKGKVELMTGYTVSYSLPLVLSILYLFLSDSYLSSFEVD